MKKIIIHAKEHSGISDLDYLETIYSKVRVGEIVKFKGKAYIRTRPQNNKFVKNPSHFRLLSSNIYEGTCLTEDADGEAVELIAHYSVVLDR